MTMDPQAAAGYGGGFPGGRYGGSPAPGYSYGGNEAFMAPPLMAPPRPVNFHTRSLGLLVMLPVLVFVAISLCYCWVYHEKPAVIWSVTAFCLCLSMLFMVARQKNGAPRFWFNVGFLVLLATVAANVGGQWNFHRHFFMYWAYEGQREYSNVSPKEPALSHLDGGKLIFTDDARVDVAASVGLLEGEDRVCVAPIVVASSDSSSWRAAYTAAGRSSIEYWAAGVNCCGDGDGRTFTCDDIRNKQAHAGLVFLDYGPRRKLLETFVKAAKEAGTTHGMEPAQDAMFVMWVVDPDDAQHWYWHAGTSFLAGGTIVYLEGGIGTMQPQFYENSPHRWRGHRIAAAKKEEFTNSRTMKTTEMMK
mmetsp:Transcript_117535/g.374501  ORF Transcript_117535/g.374501 Transcript_117535/m.374501 type:complete len:361 (-) Transcript_117535:215-1297(-)